MILANRIQDQVINALFKKKVKKKDAPKKGSPLLRSRYPTLPPVIRRVPKTPELEDDFKFAIWQKNQEALRNEISGPTATSDNKKKIATLELLERAYEAEQSLDKVPDTGTTTLPPKTTDVVTITPGMGAAKSDTRNLADMASWIKG